jgi:hypothetical protein
MDDGTERLLPAYRLRLHINTFASRLHLRNTHHRIYHFPFGIFFGCPTFDIDLDLQRPFHFAKIYSFFLTSVLLLFFLSGMGQSSLSFYLPFYKGLCRSIPLAILSPLTQPFQTIFGNFGNDLSVHLHFNLYHTITISDLTWLLAVGSLAKVVDSLAIN